MCSLLVMKTYSLQPLELSLLTEVLYWCCHIHRLVNMATMLATLLWGTWGHQVCSIFTHSCYIHSTCIWQLHSFVHSTVHLCSKISKCGDSKLWCPYSKSHHKPYTYVGSLGMCNLEGEVWWEAQVGSCCDLFSCQVQRSGISPTPPPTPWLHSSSLSAAPIIPMR